MDKKNLSYLARASLFLAFYGLLLIVMFFFQIGTPTESSAWVYELNRQKISTAEAIQGKKILIVAGSNALFGVKAELIEKQTGIKTVNMAVRAALGTQYIFDKIRQVARPGDIVIMPLEYGLYMIDTVTPTHQLVDYILSRDPDYFYQLPLREKIRYVSVLAPVEVIMRFSKLFWPDLDSMTALAAASINHHGDATKNIRGSVISSRDVAIRTRELDGYVPDNYAKAPPSSVGMLNVSDFASWCRNNKVTLMATFPNLMFNPHYKKPSSKKFFDDLVVFYQDLGVPVLGHPYTFMYARQDFYNSVYHLYSDAADRRTLRLLSLLKSTYPRLAAE